MHQAFVQIYKESGLRGLWRGSVVNVQRAALVSLGGMNKKCKIIKSKNRYLVCCLCEMFLFIYLTDRFDNLRHSQTLFNEALSAERRL